MFTMSCCTGHLIKSRFNAWLFEAGDDRIHKVYGGWKHQIFDDLPDSVVEIGPGVGANFRYYHRGIHLTVIEPNPMMYDRLRKRAEHHGIDLDIRESRAEDLDLPDQSTDAVVTTLALCSVDQTQVLNQIYRILRPGGRLLFLEHIVAPKGTLLRRLQYLIRQPWRWWFGCMLNCKTDITLRTAGFSNIELEYFELKGLLSVPAKHHIVGIATK